jgi:hypothetical protein
LKVVLPQAYSGSCEAQRVGARRPLEQSSVPGAGVNDIGDRAGGTQSLGFPGPGTVGVYGQAPRGHPRCTAQHPRSPRPRSQGRVPTWLCAGGGVCTSAPLVGDRESGRPPQVQRPSMGQELGRLGSDAGHGSAETRQEGASRTARCLVAGSTTTAVRLVFCGYAHKCSQHGAVRSTHRCPGPCPSARTTRTTLRRCNRVRAKNHLPARVHASNARPLVISGRRRAWWRGLRQRAWQAMAMGPKAAASRVRRAACACFCTTWPDWDHGCSHYSRGSPGCGLPCHLVQECISAGCGIFRPQSSL